MRLLERRLIKLEAQAAACGHDGGPLLPEMGGLTRQDFADLSDDDLDKVIAADSPYEECKRIKGMGAPDSDGGAGRPREAAV